MNNTILRALACIAIVNITAAQTQQHPDIYVHGSVPAPAWNTSPNGRWNGAMPIGKTLLIGGDRYEAGGFIRSTNTYHVRDEATGVWSPEVASPINQRAGFELQFCPLDGHAYLVCGVWNTTTGGNLLASNYRVDMSAAGIPTFTQMANAPMFLSNYGMCWYPDAGAFLIAGGLQNGVPGADVLVFNVDQGGTWGVLPNAIVDVNGQPVPMSRVSLTRTAGGIFITGGLDASNQMLAVQFKWNPLQLKFQPVQGALAGVYGDHTFDRGGHVYSLFGATAPQACLGTQFPTVLCRHHQDSIGGNFDFVGLNLTGGPALPSTRFQPFVCELSPSQLLVVSGIVPTAPILCAAGQPNVVSDAWILVK